MNLDSCLGSSYAEDPLYHPDLSPTAQLTLQRHADRILSLQLRPFSFFYLLSGVRLSTKLRFWSQETADPRIHLRAPSYFNILTPWTSLWQWFLEGVNTQERVGGSSK